MAIFSYLLFWRPDPNQPMIFFLISGLWGVGDAVWQTQINGLYGTLFRRNKEAAFSNYRLWESLGFVIAYAYSTGKIHTQLAMENFEIINDILLINTQLFALHTNCTVLWVS